METILAQARALDAGTHRAADDSWKWAMGDTIAQMQELVKHARKHTTDPEVRATPDAKTAARRIADLYDDFLPDSKQSKHRRGVLVDFAAVANQFPSGDPVRTGLTHSHARALARVKSPKARADLTDQALRLRWSVARLQGEINTAGRSPAGDTRTEDGPPAKWTKTQNSTWVCAQTKRPITNREAMVELHVQPESKLDVAVGRRTKRGGAAKKKSNGEEPNSPRVLRFESKLALATWIVAHLDLAELEAAGLAPLPGPMQKRASQITEKRASQVIVWPKFTKPLIGEPPVDALFAGEAPREELVCEHPAGEGKG